MDAERCDTYIEGETLTLLRDGAQTAAFDATLYVFF